MIFKVDDILIATKNMSEVDKLKGKLKQESEMKDLGEAKKILEIEIHKNRRKENLFLLRRNTSRRCWRD